jgi:hypothetical protein
MMQSGVAAIEPCRACPAAAPRPSDSHSAANLDSERRLIYRGEGEGVCTRKEGGGGIPWRRGKGKGGTSYTLFESLSSSLSLSHPLFPLILAL